MRAGGRVKLYAFMNRFFRRSYAAKLLAVAFVGTHVPLLVLAVWVIWRGWDSDPLLPIMGMIALAATLVGTGLTLYLLHALLAPVRTGAAALRAYEDEGRLPTLRVDGEDDAARLLVGIQRTLHAVDDGVRELQRVAVRDGLTGLYNRRGSQQHLEQSVQAHAQGAIPALCLLVLDMDNLKTINDERGHASGDDALVQLAASLGALAEDNDWVGRWGGDEFLAGFHQPAAAMQAKLDAWLQTLDQTEPPLHVSIGLAERKADEPAERLYRRADAAMYQAKSEGGRKLLLAQDLG